MSILDYLLKANLYLALFFACYWFLLRRHTFFRLNRFYLLGSLVLSLFLPQIEFSPPAIENLPVGVITLPTTVLAQAPTPTGPDWEQIGWVAYGLVAGILLLRFLGRLRGVYVLIQRSERRPQEDFTLVLPHDERVPTFSFLRYLVLSLRDYDDEVPSRPGRGQGEGLSAPSRNGLTSGAGPILAHELVHIRQWHSLDVLFVETMQVLFWYNPVLIWYGRAIRQIHEYLADAAAEDKQQYAAFLVEYALGAQAGAGVLTNGFLNASQLRERIRMMHRRATSRWAMGKYLLVAPLALGLLAMTTERPELTQLLPSMDNHSVAITAAVAADPITVTGQVLAADGTGLPGANVVIKGTRSGTTTDANGRFQLRNVKSTDTLVVSFVGYESQQAVVGNHTAFSFSLVRQSGELNKITVFGYVADPDISPAPKKEVFTVVDGPGNHYSADQQGPAPKKEVSTVVEEAPEFPGGQQALNQYLIQSLRYPAAALRANIMGKVFVQFVISETGEVGSLRVLKGIGFGCDEEAVRAVSRMPNWKPGRQQGKAVAVQFTLPVEFAIEGPSATETKEERRGQITEPAEDNSLERNIALDGQFERPNGFGESPLLVIDDKVSGRLGDLRDPSSNKLNPNNIDHINSMKAPYATAKYGSQGSDGVVEIYTKDYLKKHPERRPVYSKPTIRGNAKID